MPSFQDLIAQLNQGSLEPVYLLQGEETYFIDKAVSWFETSLLTEAEKSFDLSICYGKDTDAGQLMDIARRYPMTARYHLVILKEAQQMKTLAQILPYVEHPSDRTILVIGHKYKSVDKRAAFGKYITNYAATYTFDRLKDYLVVKWIADYISSKRLKIDPGASALLFEHLGNDLSRIANSLDKLALNLKEGDIVTADEIEKYIGIHKDYNIFELNNALMKQQAAKANAIINYFTTNQRAGHISLVLGTLNSLFSRLYVMSTLPPGNSNLASVIGVNPYFVKDYQAAGRHFTKERTEKIIGYLHEYDLRSKGVKNGGTTHGELLRELVYKILN